MFCQHDCILFETKYSRDVVGLLIDCVMWCRTNDLSVFVVKNGARELSLYFVSSIFHKIFHQRKKTNNFFFLSSNPNEKVKSEKGYVKRSKEMKGNIIKC